MSLRNASHDWHIVHSSVTASSFFFVQLYFEKGCREKSTRQSQMLLWVFRVHCSSKTFERMTREATEIRLRVLEESNKSRFDSYSVRNCILIICHITCRDCHVHIFSDNLSGTEWQCIIRIARHRREY